MPFWDVSLFSSFLRGLRLGLSDRLLADAYVEFCLEAVRDYCNNNRNAAVTHFGGISFKVDFVIRIDSRKEFSLLDLIKSCDLSVPPGE